MKAVIFFIATASATTFVSQPFPKTVERSPIIVHARAKDSVVQWEKGADGLERLFTRTEFQLQEVLKGGAAAISSTFLVREIGGEKDGVGLQVPGAARFSPGEEVVLFLTPPNPGTDTFGVKGMSYGKLNVIQAPDGTTWLSGLATQNDTSEHNSNTPTWTLAKLRDLIGSGNGVAASPEPANISQTYPHPSSNPPTLFPSASPMASTLPLLDSGEDPPRRRPWSVILFLGTGLGALAYWARSKRR